MLRLFYRNYLIFMAILLMCVASLGYILIVGEQQIDKSDDWIFHTHETIIELEQLSTLIARMVSAQRGYLLSGDEVFLDEYYERKAQVSKHLANLNELTAENLSQQSRLGELRQYFAKLSEKLEARTEQVPPEATKQTLDDVEIIKRLKSDIFRINEDFLGEEYGLLNQRIRNVENKKDQYFSTLIIGGSVAVILLLIFNAYLLRVQSKRTAAESALSEREEVFRLAMEGTNDGVFDWNIKTGEVFYSKQYAAMLGYEQGDLEPNIKSGKGLIHPEDKEEVLKLIELYKDGKLSEYATTFRMQHKSGRWVWVHSRANLIRDKKGQAVRMVGAHTDVSASKEYELCLKEAKQKAEAANRAKSDFLAHMSHEIRTPLTTISGVAEILEQGLEGFDEKQQNLIRVLGTSAVSLKDLISDVLDFSKIESDELDLEEKAFDLEEVFAHIISVMSVRANEKKLNFAFNYDKVKNVCYYGDPVRLRQILINLISNALKFTEKGHVRVKATKSKKNGAEILKVEVEDTGVGIKKDHFGLIFERFKQADSSVSRRFGGTGLGLPISKRLAGLMGGDIEVKSETGKGSTFILMLPMRVVENEVNEKPAVDDVRKSKINDKLRATISDTHKILMVEDYDGNVVVLGYVLDDMGIQYDVANTGLEAVNLWKENHYDLILMDIQMPEMDGFTATQQIRRIEDEKGIDRTPIIGMTAHALVGDKDKCIESGMDYYLPKPIVEVDLKAAILKYINKRKKAA